GVGRWAAVGGYGWRWGMVNRRRRRLLWGLLVLLLAGAAAAGGWLVFGRVAPQAPAPVGVFDVTHYGAVGDGKTDSSAAMQKAIDAAQAAGGGKVYRPAGDYVSNSMTDSIPRGAAVTVEGAGRDTTRILGAAGRKLLSVQADHSAVADLTFDSYMHGGGPALGLSASYVSVRHCCILGAPAGSWRLRFAGGQG